MTPAPEPDPRSILKTYQGPLRRFVQQRVASIAEAEDILQEVWYQYARLSQPITNLKAWLFRVARNQIIDSYRKKSPDWLEDYLWEGEEGISDFLISPGGPEEDYLRAQFWEGLYEALDALPDAQREVFLQHELEGLTLREIAEQQGAPLKTIISRKGYAVRQLRVALADVFAEWVDDFPEEVD
ncbi:MAG: RNA polymerase sigma factor [Bacteroidetes bacterium]|nr:MAG: RNA polymerase sigma factor [Bacteroidota bacterium]